MQVFGDSNIKLYQPLVTIAALDYNTQKEFPVDVYVDGEYALTTSAATVDSFRVSPGVHNVTLSTNGTMHYYLINGTEVDQDNSLTYEFPYDTNVVALVDTGSTNSTWLYVPIFAAIFVAAAVIVGLLVITRRRRKQKTAKT
jgi:hypothetical protein